MIIQSTSVPSEEPRVHERPSIDSEHRRRVLGSLLLLAIRAGETSSSFGFTLAHAARAGLRRPCDLAISAAETAGIGSFPRARKIVDRFDRKANAQIARAEDAVRSVARTLREGGHGDAPPASSTCDFISNVQHVPRTSSIEDYVAPARLPIGPGSWEQAS